MESQIDSIAKRYWKVAIWILVALTILGLFLIQIVQLQILTTSLVFSLIYSVGVTLLYSICWRSIAHRSPCKLGLYYIVSSVLQMILALVIILMGIFFIFDDLYSIFGFTVIFVCFYLVVLVYNCIYFARIEKKYLLNE